LLSVKETFPVVVPFTDLFNCAETVPLVCSSCLFLFRLNDNGLSCRLLLLRRPRTTGCLPVCWIPKLIYGQQKVVLVFKSKTRINGTHSTAVWDSEHKGCKRQGYEQCIVAYVSVSSRP